MTAAHCAALMALVPLSVSRSMITSSEWMREQVAVRRARRMSLALLDAS